MIGRMSILSFRYILRKRHQLALRARRIRRHAQAGALGGPSGLDELGRACQTAAVPTSLRIR